MVGSFEKLISCVWGGRSSRKALHMTTSLRGRDMLQWCIYIRGQFLIRWTAYLGVIILFFFFIGIRRTFIRRGTNLDLRWQSRWRKNLFKEYWNNRSYHFFMVDSIWGWRRSRNGLGGNTLPFKLLRNKHQWKDKDLFSMHTYKLVQLN